VRDTETERQRDRETDRQRDREIERQRDRDKKYFAASRKLLFFNLMLKLKLKA
jgi:hypothetical protein